MPGTVVAVVKRKVRKRRKPTTRTCKICKRRFERSSPFSNEVICGRPWFDKTANEQSTCKAINKRRKTRLRTAVSKKRRRVVGGNI